MNCFKSTLFTGLHIQILQCCLTAFLKTMDSPVYNGISDPEPQAPWWSKLTFRYCYSLYVAVRLHLLFACIFSKLLYANYNHQGTILSRVYRACFTKHVRCSLYVRSLWLCSSVCSWTLPLLRKGQKRRLERDDLYQLPDQIHTANVTDRLER